MKIILNKSLNIILLFILFITILTSNVFAESTKKTMKDVFSDADTFVSSDIESSVKISVKESSIKSVSKLISGVLTIAGVVIAFIMIAIMGINFMIQSVEEKAKIKESLIPFLIGAIITFGAFGIWKIAINLLYDL